MDKHISPLRLSSELPDSHSASEYSSSSDASDDHENYTSDTEDDESDDLPYYEKTIHEIQKGDSYACMICTVEMDHTCHMYACPECYRVYDYECIREWALKSSQKSLDKTWKCPNCYYVNSEIPVKNRHTCWCGKVVHPESNPIDPNSCGQTCNAPICAHGCSKPCHLGPHPECMRTTKVKCLCGKHTKDMFCYQSEEEKASYQCGEPCNLLLPCGVHKCQRKCHSGPCGNCEETISGKIMCYCGMETREQIICKDVKPVAKSKNKSGEIWIGVFSCAHLRSVEYSCGHHSFQESCTAPPTNSGELACPFSPRLLKTCPCGSTPLKLLEAPRKNCTDPIPTCENRCNKPLKCGKHSCPFVCHDGPCMDPCVSVDKVSCSCYSKSFLVPCQFHDEAHCNTKCESLMSCRRHRCTERCCSGRSLAIKREKTIFLARDRLDESLVEAQHICLKPCNLKLSCGIHYCQRKCHPGKCSPCLESDSNDLSCPCGKTVVPAPVRCGTKLPPCRHPCIKTLQADTACGHPPMPHECHSLEQPCPQCTAPIYKRCKCNKVEKVRTLCFQNDVSCGKICGLPLKNCSHTCKRTCHEPGQCQTICKQICGLPRKFCEHTCFAKCHPGKDCPDEVCQVKVKVTCSCGRKESILPCDAHADQPSSKLLITLPCDDKCEESKRHRMLMEAFGINEKVTAPVEELRDLVESAKSFDELHLPFTESTLSVYSKQRAWCNQIESFLSKLMRDVTRTSLHFKPMKLPQRRFIHELANAYALYSESQDREPKRSVFVKKVENKSHIPLLSLGEALPLYHSFKQLQKERKAKELEKSTTRRLFNYTVDDANDVPHNAEFNSFLVKGVAPGVTKDELSDCLAEYLQFTLIQNPSYQTLENGDFLIYPEDHMSISENVENDIKRLAPYISSICKEKQISEGVELYKIDGNLKTFTSEEYLQEEQPEKQVSFEINTDGEGAVINTDKGTCESPDSVST